MCLLGHVLIKNKCMKSQKSALCEKAFFVMILIFLKKKKETGYENSALNLYEIISFSVSNKNFFIKIMTLF